MFTRRSPPSSRARRTLATRRERLWRASAKSSRLSSPFWNGSLHVWRMSRSPPDLNIARGLGRFRTGALALRRAVLRKKPGHPSSCQISIRNLVIALPHKIPLRRPMHFWPRKGARSNSLSYTKRRRKPMHLMGHPPSSMYRRPNIKTPCRTPRALDSGHRFRSAIKAAGESPCTFVRAPENADLAGPNSSRVLLVRVLRRKRESPRSISRKNVRACARGF